MLLWGNVGEVNVVSPKIELNLFFLFGNLVPEAVVEKPPEADAWYKMALEKARSIAQSMKEGGPAPVKLESEVKPEIVKTEKEIKPEAVKQEVDEYGSGSTTVQAGPAAPAPSDAEPVTSMNLLSGVSRLICRDI